MILPKITDLDVSGKRVIVRADLDVGQVSENDIRLKSILPTLEYLLEKKSKVIIIGHRGRPEGKVDNKYSLKPVSDVLSKILGKEIKFIFDISGIEAKTESENLADGEIMMLENLRFDSREESNDEEFSKKIAELGEIYINDAFGVSHRSHASIVGVPKILPHAAGIHFSQEIENLSKVFENPERPLVILISGIKKDKVEMIKPLSEIADKVLVGGRLPEYVGDDALVSIRTRTDFEKVLMGNLNMDKEDITLNTIDRFVKEVGQAKMIVLAGVLGKYEDEGHRQGTERVFKAVAESSAFKIVGGGDSLNAVSMYNLSDKFNWISTGGGAMIEFITKKTLPGIDILQ
ncbi:MAG: phosphoglycerate kinase [Microgenomates group bacterium]